MIKTVDKVLNDTIFKILIVSITFLMQVHFVHVMYGGYVKYVLAFGVLVCGWQLFNKTLLGKLNDKVSILLLAFSVSYAITILLNRDNCFSQNINQLVYMIVFFLLLFMVGREKTYDDVKREMIIISCVIVVVSFVLAVLTITLYIYNIGEWYTITGSCDQYVIGKMWNLFWGFGNPNICGALSTISVLASMFLFPSVIKSGKSLKAWIICFCLLLNIGCEYLVMVLVESRGGYYGLLVSLAAFVFFRVLKSIYGQLTLRIVLASALSVSVVVGVVYLTSVVKPFTEEVVLVSADDAIDSAKDTKFENRIEEILNDFIVAGTPQYGKIGGHAQKRLSIGDVIASTIGREDQSDSFSNGRMEIWFAGIATFKNAPLFGLTREGMVDIVCDQFAEDADTSAIVGGGLHNMYLTVLCASGIVGFVILAAAVCIVLYRFFKCLVKSPQIDMCMLFAFIICLFFFVTELVENRILYQVNFFNVVFWIYFGYLNKLSLLKLEELSEK